MLKQFKSIKSIKIIAFTLAEVLITLSIIGIVAALTIPQLINNTNDSELKNSWIKAYSILSDAASRARIDNGGTQEKMIASNFYQTLLPIYQQYLSFQKTCPNDAVAEGCWHTTFKSYNGLATCDTSITGSCDFWQPNVGNPFRGGILNNGMLFLLQGNYPTCTDTDTSMGCARMTVDVNGFKPPNVYGKDIFTLVLDNTKTVPYNHGVTGWLDNANSTSYILSH